MTPCCWSSPVFTPTADPVPARHRPVLWLVYALLLSTLAACQSTGPEANGAVLPSSDPDQEILITFSQTDDNEAGLLNSFSNAYYRAGYGPSLSTRHKVLQIEREYPLLELDGWMILSLGVYCGRFRVHRATDAAGLLTRLRADSRVESAQALFTYQTLGTPVYNDPYFSVQYGASQPFIEQLHRWSTGRGVDIAIIDTAVDAGHPELSRQIERSRDFVSEHRGANVGAIHGTAMAGIIGAAANNGSGIVGLAPDARLWALQACEQVQRHSSRARCDSFSLARALSFAVDQGIDVINLSLSGPRDPLVERLVAAALDRGLIVIAADPGRGELRFPAMLDGVIAARQGVLRQQVGTADSKLLIVSTPRTEVLSTGPAGGYDYYSGSSVSTAIASGLAALLHEKFSTATPRQRADWINAAAPMAMRFGPMAAADSPAEPALGIQWP